MPPPERPKAAPIGEPPKDLAGEARAEWLRIMPALASVVTSLDREMAALYYRAVGEAASLEARLRKTGDTYTTTAGVILARPEVRMLEVARRTAHRLASELGLTPASRARLGIELEQDLKPDPIEDLLSR